ncbi:hypothetical protein AB0F17_58735 [Nonomuraea sp. NPDC026600]|uniref:hypothetical protein n=1 Tax=Nonomuraea sp. NPDC026600 TaxID=3155363 RepID=UPI0033F5515E
MSLYERFVDGVKVERAFTVDGSEDDARHAALADSGVDGWRAHNVEGSGNHGPGPTTPEQDGAKQPPQSANKDAWVDWAVSHGMDRDAAEDLTKAQLIELADQLAKE